MANEKNPPPPPPPPAPRLIKGWVDNSRKTPPSQPIKPQIPNPSSNKK